MNKILPTCQGVRPVELKKNKPKITSYSGLLLTYESILDLGLDRLIDVELPQALSLTGGLGRASWPRLIIRTIS